MSAQIVLLLSTLSLVIWAMRKPEVLIVYLAFYFSGTDILLDTINVNISNLMIKLTVICLTVFLFVVKYPVSVQRYLMRLQKSKFAIGYCVILLMGLVGVSFSYTNTPDKLLIIRNAFIYNLIPLCLFFVFYNERIMFRGFLLQVIIMSIAMSYIVVRFVDLTQIVIGDRTSLGSLGVDSITLSQLALVSLLVGLVYTAYGKSLIYRAFSLLTSLLSVYVLLIGSQRGVLIGIAIALLTWLMFKSKINSLYKPLIAIALIVSSVVFLNIERFGIVERFADLERYQEYERYNDYFRSAELFISRPFFGYGTMGYYEQTGRQYPHNMFLEIMVEYGLIGLLLLGLMLREALKAVYMIIRDDDASYGELAIALCWIGLFVSAQFSGNLAGNNYFYAVSGIVCAISQNYLHHKRNSLNMNKLHDDVRELNYTQRLN